VRRSTSHQYSLGANQTVSCGCETVRQRAENACSGASQAQRVPASALMPDKAASLPTTYRVYITPRYTI